VIQKGISINGNHYELPTEFTEVLSRISLIFVVSLRVFFWELLFSLQSLSKEFENKDRINAEYLEEIAGLKQQLLQVSQEKKGLEVQLLESKQYSQKLIN